VAVAGGRAPADDVDRLAEDDRPCVVACLRLVATCVQSASPGARRKTRRASSHAPATRRRRGRSRR
jgi:hypothetical protein